MAIAVACLAVAVGVARASDLPAVGALPITPIPSPPREDPRVVALGAALFASPDLSDDRGRSCASCHDLATNGTTDARFDRSAAGVLAPVRTPTVFNSALNWRLDWRGDVRTLEQQADLSIRGRRLMAGTPAIVLGRLRHSPVWRARFAVADGRAPDWPDLLEAIATFERTLLTPDSRFDRWLEGDTGALSATEHAGFDLFSSLGCISCHQGANIGGNLFERQGVVNAIGVADRGLFRVPSLRNVAARPPFFHDGSAPTLAVAVRLMGARQLGAKLSATDVGLIVAFLDTLTGRFDGHVVAAHP